MSANRIVAGVDGATAVGAAVDGRTEPVSVAVWIEVGGLPTQGSNLAPAAARRLAELVKAAADAAERPSAAE